MFVALVGTDTQYLIDMLEEMFWEGTLVDPEELLRANEEAKFEAARRKEETLAKAEGKLDPSKGNIIYPKSLPMHPILELNLTFILKTSLTGKKALKQAK